jgi:hypothetical protein
VETLDSRYIRRKPSGARSTLELLVFNDIPITFQFDLAFSLRRRFVESALDQKYVEEYIVFR